MTKLNRDIASALSGAPDKLPLDGHTSEETAYVVPDYPYGYTLRTQIRYWLEHKPKKGWRFVSQTMNPKTARWNKPKASTYTEWGAAMYLDEKGHVHWDGIGPYSDERKILAFLRTFPHAKTELRAVVPAKMRYLRGRISGDIVWKINGVTQPTSEAEIEKLREELATWEEIQTLVE